MRNFFKIFLIWFLFFATTAYANNKNFLSLADIHFDPFIYCEGVTPCPLIQELRKAPVSNWTDIFQARGKEYPQYKQDSNYFLLKSSLKTSAELAVKNHAEFVLVLGDLIGHDYRKLYRKYSQDHSYDGYQSFVNKTYQFLTNNFAEAFPGIDVYFLVGNNDSYRGDYLTDVNGPFYNDMGKMWSTLIKNKNNKLEMQKDFSRAGYYAVNIPQQPNLRLIVLNSVLFSNNAKGRGNDKAAKAQLAWLHEELVQVKNKNQKALIAMHIPAGIDVYATLRVKLFTFIELWRPEYTRAYKKELQEFAPQIMAILSGHLHADWFQILTFEGTAAEIAVTGTPAISPLFSNNPGFKIYSYSPKTLELDDFITYYYAIPKQVWDKEYDFKQMFYLNCRSCAIIDHMKLLEQTGKLASYYQFFFMV